MHRSVPTTAATLLAALALVVDAAAQTRTIHPPELARVWGDANGTGTGITASSGRTQYLHLAPLPIGTNVIGIGWRRSRTTRATTGYMVECEVALSNSMTVNASMASRFSSNIGMNNTVVLPRGFYNVPSFSPNATPDDFITLPLSQQFLFVGPNLIIDIETFSTTATAPFIRVDRCFESTIGQSVAFGEGCGSARGDTVSAQRWVPGSSFDATLTLAPPNQPAFLMAGGDLVFFSGGVPLPFDLGPPLGMTGCQLIVDPLAAAATTTNGSGNASLTLSIPNVPSLGNAAIGFQWFYVDPSAVGGAAVTRGEMVTIGPRSCPGRYVFTSTPNAIMGQVIQGVPVTLLLTP